MRIGACSPLFMLTMSQKNERGRKMSNSYLISDAAKQVNVEAHVLRYWEEELGLPIKRNELGHRFYTQADVERFREIKDMKERGLQLKAIRMILKDGKLDRLDSVSVEELVAEKEIGLNEESEKFAEKETSQELPVEMPAQTVYNENGEDKAKRLQWLLQQLFRETLQENNRELCQMMKESVLKELDYQFRVQEERGDERHAELLKKEEEHFRKVDELLRKKRRLLKK